VFEAAALSVTSIVRDLKDKHNLWSVAGARKLQGLDWLLCSSSLEGVCFLVRPVIFSLG
jgi:hypothetical protein